MPAGDVRIMGRSGLTKTHKALPKKDQLVLVGGGKAKRHAEGLLVEKLREDVRFAARVGVIMKRARADFARAYPQETRQNLISNDEWRRSGFEELAAANELMKLEGS